MSKKRDREGKGKGRPRPMKGFRPGKEPSELRKRRAKARLNDDAAWTQEKLIDAVGDRSPDEVRTMVRRWTLILLGATVVLAVVGALLYGWSRIAGIAVHVLTFVAAFLTFRLWRQREDLVKLAEWVRRA